MLASMKKGCKFAPRYEPIKHTTMIGEVMMEKFLDRAYTQGLDACTCKLRRGLKVTFYSK